MIQNIPKRRVSIGPLAYRAHKNYTFIPTEQPTCPTSKSAYTIKHVLTECEALVPSRKTFFNMNNISELFERATMGDIILFLKIVDCYQKIDKEMNKK